MLNDSKLLPVRDSGEFTPFPLPPHRGRLTPPIDKSSTGVGAKSTRRERGLERDTFMCNRGIQSCIPLVHRSPVEDPLSVR
jgi:hypothetical protein